MSQKRAWSQGAYVGATQEMPKRVRLTVVPKKKTKKVKKSGPGTKVSRALIGSANVFLPKKKRFTFSYSDMVTVNGLAAGAFQGHAFNGNGLYDPDDTGTGHQPRGFDQMKALYRTYKVNASTIRVRFVGTSTGAGVVCGLFADASSDSNPTTAYIYDVLEIYKNNAILSNTDGSRSIVELTDRRTTTSMQYNKESDSSEALMTANPGNTWLWRIIVWNAHTSAAFTGQIFVDLTYEAEFSEPVEPLYS